MKQYDAYLFDGDGTLYDTADMIYRCFVDIADKFKRTTIDRDKVYKTIGMPFRPQLELLIGKVSDEEFDSIVESHIAFAKTIYKDSVKLFDGIKETIAELKNRDKKLAVVTSRKFESVSMYLEHTDILQYFDELITPESTAMHKPHPAPAIEAMRRLDVEPQSTLFIGDATFDIDCGNAAGCDTCYVNWSMAGHKPEHIGADYYIDKITEILNWAE